MSTVERTLEVDLRRKREEEERARKRKSVGDSRREEKKERKRRKMAHTHTHTHTHFDHEDAKKDTHVPISSAVDKQFTEPGGHKVKLLIPLNSCTPSLGAGALLPTSKMTPRDMLRRPTSDGAPPSPPIAADTDQSLTILS